MADFRQMGGMPEGYDQILNNARSTLVRMPDGTYAPAPTRGGATSLQDIYGGILPDNSSGLTARSVNTVPVDGNGNPIIPQPGFVADTMGATRNEQSGSRPAITQGTQPAGTVQMPPGARPSILNSMFAQMGPQYQPDMTGRSGPPSQAADPFGTRIANQDQSRLPSNQGEQAFMDAFYPSEQNPALGAIDQLTGSGNSTLPRTRPMSLSPRGLAGIGAPSPQQGNYTIRKGDTLSGISQKTGIPVAQLAKLNGIANPNLIRAGASLSLGGQSAPIQSVQAPRQNVAPSGQMTTQPKQQALASALSSTRSRQLQEGRDTLLDQFGMLRQ